MIRVCNGELLISDALQSQKDEGAVIEAMEEGCFEHQDDRKKHRKPYAMHLCCSVFSAQ